jgi:sterol O-acyltransferase
MFITFVMSALAHELVMAVVTKKIRYVTSMHLRMRESIFVFCRMYLFLLQLIQIPLIAVSRTPAIKRNKLMGNIVFWVGLYAGFPLLCVAYVAY